MHQHRRSISGLWVPCLVRDLDSCSRTPMQCPRYGTLHLQELLQCLKKNWKMDTDWQGAIIRDVAAIPLPYLSIWWEIPVRQSAQNVLYCLSTHPQSCHNNDNRRWPVINPGCPSSQVARNKAKRFSRLPNWRELFGHSLLFQPKIFSFCFFSLKSLPMYKTSGIDDSVKEQLMRTTAHRVSNISPQFVLHLIDCIVQSLFKFLKAAEQLKTDEKSHRNAHAFLHLECLNNLKIWLILSWQN